MYMFQPLLSASAGCSLISFGVMKIFWLQFGLHFYIEGREYHYLVNKWIEGGVTVAFIAVGIILLSAQRTILVSALGITLIASEYLFLIIGDHSLLQMMVPIGILTNLILLIYSEVSLFNRINTLERAHAEQNRVFSS